MINFIWLQGLRYNVHVQYNVGNSGAPPRTLFILAYFGRILIARFSESVVSVLLKLFPPVKII